MPAGSLGYEWDADLDNGARPAGLIRLSSATYNLSGDLLLDNGSTFGNGPATHNLTLYRAASGALVFGAGTVQWAWGLDANHDRSGMAVDQDMRQATVNLFADMGVQPGDPAVRARGGDGVDGHDGTDRDGRRRPPTARASARVNP